MILVRSLHNRSGAFRPVKLARLVVLSSIIISTVSAWKGGRTKTEGAAGGPDKVHFTAVEKTRLDFFIYTKITKSRLSIEFPNIHALIKRPFYFSVYALGKNPRSDTFQIEDFFHIENIYSFQYIKRDNDRGFF
jgi:hypothetical protein